MKRITDPMLGFKSFWSAKTKPIACIETMHMVKKGQQRCPKGQPRSAADQFDSLAFRNSMPNVALFDPRTSVRQNANNARLNLVTAIGCYKPPLSV